MLGARKWQCTARSTQRAMHNTIIATRNAQRAPTLQTCEIEKGKRAGWRMRSAPEEKRNRNDTTESISCASQLRSRVVREARARRRAGQVFHHFSMAWPLSRFHTYTVTHQSEPVPTLSSHLCRKMKDCPSVAFFGSLTAVFEQNHW